MKAVGVYDFEIVEDVIARMREVNRREMTCTSFDGTLDEFIGHFDASASISILRQALLTDEAAPVAILDLQLVSPHVVGVTFFATDDWPLIARAAHRWLKRMVMNRVIRPTYARAQCTGMPASARWLGALGFDCEGVHRNRGRNGETMCTFAWINTSFDYERKNACASSS